MIFVSYQFCYVPLIHTRASVKTNSKLPHVLRFTTTLTTVLFVFIVATVIKPITHVEILQAVTGTAAELTIATLECIHVSW